MNFKTNNKNTCVEMRESLDILKVVSSKKEKPLNPVAVLKYNEYKLLKKYNYTMPQLKVMLKHYKLRLGGSKSELLERLYEYLRESNRIISIQRIYRGYLYRRYCKLHGPAFVNRKLCINETDFLSMDELTTIPYNQFFSFKDKDGFIYGFDIVSIYNLIYEQNGAVKNPYNGLPVDRSVLTNLRLLLKVSNILKIQVNKKVEDISGQVNNFKLFELKVVALFQAIDMLGNYSKPEWFMKLSRRRLIKFVLELYDIWVYRAKIPMNVKKNICYPSGEPFSNMSNLESIEDIYELRVKILEIMELLVYSGKDRDSKGLGAFYILGALTLVNSEAANTMPWLYQSMCYEM